MVSRICNIIKQKNLSVHSVELALGWGNGSIKRFSTSSPSIEKIFQLSEYLNIPIEYILTGKSSESFMTDDEVKLLNIYRRLSDISKTKVIERADTLLETESNRERYIEIFDLPVSAGTGIYLSSDDKKPMKIKNTNKTKHASYVLQISGDSMNPDFEDGDMILVQSTPEIKLGEIGVFILNGEGFVKQLGDQELISLNNKYNTIPFTENDIISFRGKVIGKLNKEDIIEQG